MRYLLILGALAVAPELVDAKCAPTGLRPEVLSPAGTLLAANDGIVVAAETSVDDRSLPDHDVAVQKDWRFRNGKNLVTPVIASIAPGLAVYRFPQGATGDIVLENATHEALVKAAPAKDSMPQLAAPKAKKIVATKTFGRRPTTLVEVTLDGDAPATAVALVAVGANGKPLSFGRVVEGQPLYVYVSRRCQIVTDGTVEPTAGQKVTLFWVDARGAKSPATKPITISAGKP